MPDFDKEWEIVDDMLSSDSDLSLHDEQQFEDSIDQETQEEIRPKNPANCGDLSLYTNSPISVAESLLLIMTFANTHKLSGKALSDLLTLIRLHCPSDIQTEYLQNLHTFKQFFETSASSSLILHKYCSACFITVDNENTLCSSCHANLSLEGSTSFFIEVAIEEQ